MKDILVFIEQKDNLIKKASFNTISFAKSLGNLLNKKVYAIIACESIDSVASLKDFGLDKIFFYKIKDSLSSVNFTQLIIEVVNKNDIDVLVFTHTTMGKDIASRVAVKLEAGLVTDCIEYSYENNDLVFTRPIYAGKAFEKLRFNTENKVLTVRPNSFQVSKVDNYNTLIEEINFDRFVSDTTKVIELLKSETKFDVSDAEVVIAGGRGMKDASNFALLESLADLLGGSVGASRAVVDAGWRPHSEQIGQTGKTISPKLYIACGISGAIQHLAGMSSSKCIIAINKDKDAPIFQIADYAIIGDTLEILPALIAELRKIKE